MLLREVKARYFDVELVSWFETVSLYQILGG